MSALEYFRFNSNLQGRVYVVVYGPTEGDDEESLWNYFGFG